MAVLKHIPVKNGDYQTALDYLMYQHDELSKKMIRDERGDPVFREDYLMEGINCEPLGYPIAAEMVNRKYGRNGAPGEVKAHHYVLSFDPRDADVGLTLEEAHEMAVGFAREWFGGHVGIVCTHPEGYNGSGNVHAHIVFCSVRSYDEPVREWMTHGSEWRAGGKHHATNKCHAELKQAVMDMCRTRNLHQVDLLSPPRERVSDRKYWVVRRAEIKERANAQGPSLPPGAKRSRFQTHKQQIRAAVREAMESAVNFGTFAGILKENHGIEAKLAHGRISYRHPERNGFIPGRALGIDYEWMLVDANIRYRIEHGRLPRRQSLVAQIDEAARSRGQAYVDKVRSSNVMRLSESLALIQEAGIESREELEAALGVSAESLAAAKASLAATEAALARINRGIRASGAYLSTRNAWRAYRASLDRRAFYLAHKRELEKCNAARKELSEIFPGGTCPAMDDLKAERRRLVAERNGRCEDWTTMRQRHRELEIAKRNVDTILDGRPLPREKERARGRDIELG